MGSTLSVTLVKLMPEWFAWQSYCAGHIITFVWKSPARIARLQNEQELSLLQVKESKWLVKCFLNYLRHDKSEVGALFDMLSIFLYQSRIDYTFLREFYVIENSTAGDLKRPPDPSAFPDDLSKRVKVEPGLQSLCVMSPGGASIPNIETPGSVGQPDEEYKPNAAMEEMIITFLIRVALVIEPKDKEASSMYKQALELLTQALEVWPNANVKFNYLEKLLSNIQPSQSKDPATALAQGLDVMNKVLEKQAQLFIRNNINHISQILEPCFNSKMLDAGKSLCSLLKMCDAVADSGSIISNMKCVLKLISEKVMQSPESKRLIGQILHTLLSEKGTDPSVLLCILDTVKSWIEEDFRHIASGASTAALSPKEIVSYLQKLSLVDRKNFSPSTLEEWDAKYLQLLYGICADSSRGTGGTRQANDSPSVKRLP
ncbi:hypothetical protein J5N97_012770 [Dioscorea zingiberensis]|uniref:Uncharacterized protein n=1 Tax=Dioscorea zingiberensis TaxID=325984 RepID=A0A9D5HI12_9LILI|nr:hypothetical protein J5N97_012770 [Dioscorea zingiberensis]